MSLCVHLKGEENLILFELCEGHENDNRSQCHHKHPCSADDNTCGLNMNWCFRAIRLENLEMFLFLIHQEFS